jgi:hypothetical protein
VKLIKEDGELLYIQCVSCEEEFTIKKEKCFKTAEGYGLYEGIRCPNCSKEDKNIIDYEKVLREFDEYENESELKKMDIQSPIECPKCKCTQLSANNKNFNIGGAVGGMIIFGTVGALGGFAGNKKVIITCLKCGYQWKAGKK